MNMYWWTLVILVTFPGLYFGVGHLLTKGNRELERVLLLADLDQATANVQLPRAGYLPGPGFAGAQDPAYQLAPVPWDLANAAYELGQQRAAQDDVSREVAAIIAEVEANPERWQR